MADYSYQRHPQDHGDSSYQPTYPPQAPAPPMDRGVSDVPPSYAFGSNYESGRGGGPMRGGPMRGGPMRGEPMRGCPQYQRGGFGRGGYPPQGPGGYNRTYQDVDKGPYHEREDWRQSGAGSSAPPQPYPQRPPQPRPRGSTIIIHNLPSHVTEQDLLNHFGSAGSIKMDPRTRLPEVWLGPQAGEARITFQDSQVAVNAVQWYNNGDFQGSVIHVEMDETMEPPPMPPSMGRMPMRGGPGGPGGPPPPRGDRFPPQRGGYGGMRGGRGDQGRQSFEKRDGDWICANPSCQNTNFKWRSECNRCRAPRPEGNGGDCPDMNGDFGDGDRFNSRPPFPPGGRGGPRGGGRGYPPRGMSGPPMGRGGFGGRGGPMREGRGMSDRGRGMSDRGRGGFGGRGGPNGNWRQRPY